MQKGRYPRHTVNGIRDYSHRHIWRQLKGEIPDGYEIDHINGNKHDNRIENLQCITKADNLARKIGKRWIYSPSTNKIRPYKAQRHIDGKTRHVGYYGTPCGAYMASNTNNIGN